MRANMHAPTKEKIPGGLASGKPEKFFSKRKVEEGAKVESEHTPSKAIAREIARDHLSEDSGYYRKLKKIEKMAYLAGSGDAHEKFGSALRQRIRVQPYEYSAYGMPHGFRLLLGDNEIGRAVLKGNKAQIQGMEIDPRYRAMGLGKKFYGEIKRRMPNQTLASDFGVSPDAAFAWRAAGRLPGQVVRERPPGEQNTPVFVGSLPPKSAKDPIPKLIQFPRPKANTKEELALLEPRRKSESEHALYGVLGKPLSKFGAASAAPSDASSVRDSGSPVPTTHHRDSAQNISQNFRYNASLTDPSKFTQPPYNNATMQGGPPLSKFKSDTTGGLRDS